MFDIIDIDNEIGDYSIRKRKKGAGSFWISRTVANFFIDNKIPAIEICAYLLFSCYSDKTGQFTSVSFRAFRKHLSMNEKEASEVINRLISYKLKSQYLIYDINDWYKSTANRKNIKSIKLTNPRMYRSKPKWALNTFGETSDQGVWFSKEFVEGNRKHRRPIKYLLGKSIGDLGVRLLLYLHMENDLPDSWGVNPATSCYVSYKMKRVPAIDGYEFWEGTEDIQILKPSLVRALFGQDVENVQDRQPIRSLLFGLLKTLYDQKFLYKVVCVTTNKPGSEDFKPKYLLDIKDKTLTSRPEDKFLMANRIQNIAINKGYQAGIKGKSNSWRFYSKYLALAPDGEGACIAGIYRLVYDITNRRNTSAKLYLYSAEECFREIRQLVADYKKVEKYVITNKIDELQYF